MEERIKVAINPDYPEQTIMIGSTLTEEGRNKLYDLLQRYLDIFAWKSADMTGVPRHIAEHRLNVREGCSPVRQKKRGQAANRNHAIHKEIGKLVEAGIMKDVHYHDWLSNPVMVKKHDDSWRMCIDFKDLNKACPKDGYPLPEIDWKVESLCGFPFKCFLDAYKGYHQIQMAKKDKEKTAFITSQGIFCYTKMPFGLKNAEATYQRLVDKAVHKQIARNLEVYVDDLVIKIRMEDEIVIDIEETFKTLREINMKLNPKKCAFGVEERMFLGYKVNTRGLKVCPDKVDAVLSLSSPKCLNDVQKLNGKLASLNRFLAKSAEKSLPFFKTLKKCTKKSDFHWTAEAEEAFKKSLPPRVSVKGQILASFIIERPEEDSPDTLMEVEEELREPWILFTDGSSCTYGSGAGLILTNPEGMEFTYALRLRQVPRSEKKADALSKITSTSFAHLSKQVLVKELKEKSISEVEMLAVIEEEGDTWMTPIFEYLTKYFLGPWLRCVGPLQANYVLGEIHEGSYGMHTGKRSVMAKALRIGYYWPTMHKDARTLIRACQDCQVHKPVPKNPQQKLTPIASLWLFYKWGIDIAGPFLEGPGKVKFLIVAIDYFTKWIEAKPVATISGNQIKKIVWTTLSVDSDFDDIK
ncbi:reverse transcriptase domain-containing protein [Tanacetum coccineum]